MNRDRHDLSINEREHLTVIALGLHLDEQALTQNNLDSSRGRNGADCTCCCRASNGLEDVVVSGVCDHDSPAGDEALEVGGQLIEIGLINIAC